MAEGCVYLVVMKCIVGRAEETKDKFFVDVDRTRQNLRIKLERQMTELRKGGNEIKRGMKREREGSREDCSIAADERTCMYRSRPGSRAEPWMTC